MRGYGGRVPQDGRGGKGPLPDDAGAAGADSDQGDDRDPLQGVGRGGAEEDFGAGE